MIDGISGIEVRAMTCNDIDAGMRLSALAGWNQTVADWELFLNGDAEGCFVAVHNGAVVGTVAAISYDGGLAWIGLVLVDPEFRRMGIARLLMNRVLKRLEGCPCVKLDASAAGKKVYGALGFIDEYEVRRLTHGSVPLLALNEASSGEVFRLTEKVLEGVLELDRRVFGVDRRNVIESFLNNAPHGAYYIERQGCICGFCLGRSGAKFHQIGPVVAETVDDARALVCAALREFTERSVLLDVPEMHAELLAWLAGLGFVQQRSFTRMYLGRNSSPGLLAQQFAIAGPELG